MKTTNTLIAATALFLALSAPAFAVSVSTGSSGSTKTGISTDGGVNANVGGTSANVGVDADVNASTRSSTTSSTNTHADGTANSSTGAGTRGSLMGKATNFSTLDTDRNGVVSRQEFTASGRVNRSAFATIDTNNDGSISNAEMNTYMNTDTGVTPGMDSTRLKYHTGASGSVNP